MPNSDDAPSVGEQLEQALIDASVSQRELARRLASADGGKAESKRRWIQKVLDDEIDRPEMAPVESALSLPSGYFSIRTLEQQRRRRVRLEELEAAVERLREEQLTFAEEVLARLAGLEAGQGRAELRSDRRETGDQGGAK